MMVAEGTNRTYNHVGVPDSFHPVSHHSNDRERIRRLTIIQRYHMERFADFVKKLSTIKEGDGNLLDNSIILYGSNMANSDLHNNNPLPQLLLGKGGGIKGGQHLAMPKDTPHANILLTMAQRAGVNLEKFSDSTGPLADV